MLYAHLQHHNDTINNRRRKTSLENICTSAGCWLSLLHLISILSGPQFIRAPSLVWLSLPHLASNCHWNSNSTELYNSSTPTRSPTRSLKSHVWSSSSGNNCHAVQRSLSSGASVYESIMGFFSLSHFVSQFPPTRFPLPTAIGMCSFRCITLNSILGRVEGQNTTATNESIFV